MAKYYQVIVEEHNISKFMLTVEASSKEELNEILDFYEDEITDFKFHVGGFGSIPEISDITEITETNDIDEESILDRSEYDRESKLEICRGA